MPPTDAIIMKNLVPQTYGLRVRQGYVEWANGLGNEVRSIIPYEGQAEDGSLDALFGVTGEGIFDVTLNGETTPTKEVSFYADPQPDPYPKQAGYGVYTHFTSDASAEYMFYADGDAGLYRYTGSTGAWVAAPDITGVDAADIAFVLAHKQRIWMIEKASADAWYLPVDAIQGAATKFTFGSKFKHGGQLVGLYSWSIDGGEGVDDYLIGVSRSGDVLVYRGADPTADNWELVGSWFIGEIPDTRRISVEFGSALYLLSIYGLTNISELLRGEDISNALSSPARKISDSVKDFVQFRKQYPQWQLLHLPGLNLLHLNVPQIPDGNTPYTQIVQNTLTQGWTYWEGIPANCGDTWRGLYYFGTVDGQVFVYGGGLDGTLIDETLGVARTFEVLSSFSPVTGNPAQYGNVEMSRTMVLAEGEYKINSRVVFDYNLQEKAQFPGVTQNVEVGVWDEGVWNIDVWGGGRRPKELLVGNFGIGRMGAVSTIGSTAGDLVILSWDVITSPGGLM